VRERVQPSLCWLLGDAILLPDRVHGSIAGLGRDGRATCSARRPGAHARSSCPAREGVGRLRGWPAVSQDLAALTIQARESKNVPSGV